MSTAPLDIQFKFDARPVLRSLKAVRVRLRAYRRVLRRSDRRRILLAVREANRKPSRKAPRNDWTGDPRLLTPEDIAWAKEEIKGRFGR